MVDLTECGLSFNKRLAKDIQMHIQVSVKSKNCRKYVKIQAILKDNCQDYRYFWFNATQVDENLLCIYID